MVTKARLHSLVSTTLTALVVVLGVAVPLLERADLTSDAVLESEHHASTCPPRHDHTVCTQFGVNLPLASEPARIPQAMSIRAILLPDEYGVRHYGVSVEANRSRAPPEL